MASMHVDGTVCACLLVSSRRFLEKGDRRRRKRWGESESHPSPGDGMMIKNVVTSLLDLTDWYMYIYTH
jgi:hypothetical protein